MGSIPSYGSNEPTRETASKQSADPTVDKKLDASNTKDEARQAAQPEKQAAKNTKAEDDKLVDEASAESFPASDPPSFTPIVGH